MKPLDDKKIDEILNSIGQSHKPRTDFEKWCAQNQQAVNALKTQSGKNIEEKQKQLGSYFMKSPTARLAAAAVLILAFAAAIYFSIVFNPETKVPSEPTRRIIIPAELAQLSTEELIKLYYDPSKSSFDAETIKAALQQSLERIAPEDVIQIARNLTGKKNAVSGGMGRGMARPELAGPVSDLSGNSVKTFAEIVESANLVVDGRPVSIKLNVDDIKQALLNRQKFRALEDFTNRYRVIIQLDVNDVLPKDSLKTSDTLDIPAVLNEQQLKQIKEDTEYIFAMVRNKGERPRFLEYFAGVYPVDYNNAASRELWRFFSDSQDILIFGNEPDKETIDYWISKLEGDTFALALEYMDILPDKLLPSAAIMDAVELKYRNLLLQADEAKRNFTSNAQAFTRSMKLLLRSNDKESIKRMLSLFDEDTKLADKSTMWRQIHTGGNNLLPLVLQLITASEDEQKGKRLAEAYKKYKDMPLAISGNNEAFIRDQQTRFAKTLLDEIINQSAAISDADIQAFLMEILKEHSSFEVYDAPTFEKIWKILAAGGNYDIRAYLEKFLAEPNLSDINIHLPPDKNYGEDSRFAFEQSAFKTLLSLPVSNRTPRKELLALLMQIYNRNKTNRSCQSVVINLSQQILEPQDTEFIPIIQEILESNGTPWNVPVVIISKIPNPAFAPALKATIEKLIGTVNNLPNNSLLEALFACGAEEEAVTEAVNILHKPLRENTSMNLNSDLRRNSMIVQFLGKTRREDLIGLIEEYTSQEYIEKYRGLFDDPMLDSSLNQLQQNAIMALARLGGKSAIPKLRQLYNSPDIRVRIISALALYYNGDKTGEKLLMHFVKGDQRSVPEIEIRWSRDLAGGAVFQSVIGSYLRSKFTDELLLEKFRNYIESQDINLEPGFFENNRNQLLPILVRQLNNRDRQTRDTANRILKQMTGQDFGFDSSRYAGRQDEIVKQWQKYIEELLSKSSEK